MCPQDEKFHKVVFNASPVTYYKAHDYALLFLELLPFFT